MTPYVIPFVRAVHARTHKRVVLAISAQSGKTEALFDIIGERFDTSPVPTIYLGPTKQFLTEQLEPRVMDLLDQAPSLAAKVARGKRMTKTRKLISGVPLRLAHGGSSTAIKSDPAGLGITDEADELMANVKGAGDPIRLLDRRGDTYADWVHAIVSTPSEGASDVEIDPESGLSFWAEQEQDEIASTIWRLWQAGTRYHWAWPCPHCGEYFIPRFKQLAWEKPVGPDGKERPSDPMLAHRTAHLVCPANGCIIDDDDKEGMNARGVYVAPGQRIEADGTLVGEPPDRITLSYWVSGLASPFKTWGERASEYVDAVRSGDQDEIQAVVNGGLGELYAPGGGSVPEWRELEKLKAPYVLGGLSPDAFFVTAAVDVQKRRLLYALRAWGARAESWLIHAGELFGDTVDGHVWDQLEDVLLDGVDGFPIKLALIDSGFRPGRTDVVPESRVYEFCYRHQRFCRPTKGYDTRQKPITETKFELGVDIRGRRKMVGIPALLLDTDYWKRWVHERIAWPVDAPGAWHLPEDVTEDYLKQLVSEARVRKPGGKPTWVRRSKENHFLDIEAMNAAAGWYLGAHHLKERSRERTGPEPTGKRRSLADISAQLNR